MKNVAIIISSLKGGGAERVASRLTLNLPKEKYNLYLILFDSSSMKYQYSGNLIDVDLKAENNPLKKILVLMKRYFKIKKIKLDYKINVSISFLDGPNLINIFTKRNDKVIVSVRGFPSKKTKDFYDFIGKNFIKQFYNKADLVVGVSNLVNKDLANNYKINKDKLVTLYNPFDLNNIQALSNESVEFCERNIFDKKVIITVGRLDDLKGHWHLIRAFKKVNNIDKDTKLVILGEGELRGYLQVLINDLYLENSVYLLGFKDNPYKYIAKSSLFVLPSLSEGFPNALVEAMSCGVPVISSDCKSGPREILAPETNIEYQCYEVEYAKYGVLTPSFDGIKYDCREPLTREENILADSILNLLINEDLYNKYSIKSLERAENFEINSIIKQWEILID